MHGVIHLIDAEVKPAAPGFLAEDVHAVGIERVDTAAHDYLQAGAIRLAENTIRAFLGVAGAGKAFAGLGGRERQRLDGFIGILAEAREIRTHAGVIATEHEVEHLLHIERMVEAAAHRFLVEGGLRAVQMEAEAAARPDIAEMHTLDKAAVHRLNLQPFVPDIGLAGVEDIQLTQAEELAHLRVFRNKLVHNVVHIAGIARVAAVGCPPVGHADEAHLAPHDDIVRVHRVATRSGSHAPEVAGGVIRPELRIERGAARRQRGIERRIRAGRGQGDGDILVAIHLDAREIAHVVLVVERLAAVGRGAHKERGDEIARGQAGTIGETGGFIDVEIDGAAILRYCPAVCRAGNELTRAGMQADER